MSGNTVTFDCGCVFTLDENNNICLPDNMSDYLKYLSCERTMDLFASGFTQGVFQLESELGKTWAKKLGPENEEHVSALVALLRPGVLLAVDEEGKNMAQHYVDRKNGLEPVVAYHDSLIDILESTYGVLCFQEQAMRIAQKLAGFDLVTCDTLRKSLGKKNTELMSKVEQQFITGVNNTNVVSEDVGRQIFSWIKEGQRYSFNRSHAMGYGLTSWITAFVKTHFKLEFYLSWLQFAKEKQKPLIEVRNLVSDAKLLDVEVYPPDLRHLESDFYIDGESIRFGLSNVKNVGDAQINKLRVLCEEYNIDTLDWMTLLSKILSKLNSKSVCHLISVGALDYLRVPRTRMLYEFDIWSKLTDKETEWILSRITKDDDILSMLRSLSSPKIKIAPKHYTGGGCNSEKRRQKVLDLVRLLEKPPYELKDSIDWIAYTEEELLGISVTSHKIDSCDTTIVNTTCKDFLKGKDGYIVLGVNIKEVKTTKIKRGKSKGKTMAFIKVEDSSAMLDAVVFSEEYSKFSNLLTEDNNVAIRGEKSNKDSFVIKQVYQLS